MSTPPELQVTHTSTVTPDQIDELGHMNVRYYGLNAVAATQSMCERLGIAEPRLRSTYTRHHHEQMEGNPLEVRSALLGGGDRLRIYHELRNRDDDDLAATFVHELDHAAVETPPIELPAHGRPRSLRLDTDGLATAPTLDRVRSAGLAIREERKVDEEDTGGAETIPPWLANNLIWGGERPGDDEPDWIRTLPNGDRTASATMETRTWIGRLPALGARIQSFGCIVAVHEKIYQSQNWAYDLDAGDVLAVFESINLQINLTTRKAIAIPDDERADLAARLHPEFVSN